MLKTCQKCGHPNPSASGDPMEACPECGAIYAKAQPPLRRQESAASSAAWPPSAPAAPLQSNEQTASFIERLRSQSNYPAFRSVVSVMFWLGQALAALVLIGGLISAFGLRAYGGSLGTFIGALVFAVLISVFAKVGKEASLMLADMSDATVRMAERQESNR